MRNGRFYNYECEFRNKKKTDYNFAYAITPKYFFFPPSIKLELPSADFPPAWKGKESDSPQQEISQDSFFA